MVAFRALPLTTRFYLVASELLGWRYVTGAGVRFPSEAKSIPTSLVDPDGRGIDCSSLTAWALAKAIPHANWTFGKNSTYSALQIMGADLWSPLQAPGMAGCGYALEPGTAPIDGCWHLIQAWKDDSTTDGDGISGGHARLAKSLGDGNLIVLEATSRDNKRGPTWTFITWDELLEKYPTSPGNTTPRVRCAVLAEG